MKSFWIVLTVMCFSTRMLAQSAEDSVKLVITNMFEAMKNADAAGLRAVFADSMVLQTITRTKEGATLVRNDSKEGFIDFVSKQKPGAADEQIVFESVKVDGPLASVWTPYQFYFDGKFSHCGVNSFQLVRFNGTWKIQYLIDTRRRQGCQ